jgi:hypothetical protein
MWELIDLTVADQHYKLMKTYRTELDAMTSQSMEFAAILTSLLDAILREYDNLRTGIDKNSTALVAWGCRNSLELVVFTKYVLRSSANAKNFAEDVWIDASDIFTAFREWLRSHDPTAQAPKLEQNIARLQSKLSGRSYLRVSELAKIVGFEDEYKRIHKATSKLVHPTAFSVLGYSDGGTDALGPELRQNFFATGIRYGLDALKDIKDHVEKHGVEPLP